ncbi:hypothetical protein KSP35_21470 [Aquihabitans sp. G128]|uniref:hypothetical protein n=1 Tax=Aquihabitans sp. G128 TaxID=2849779 RepID=UPI001C20F977|nr:hypothetical protein [Aquihabitans sp. G128]QXC60859.1 hypothetical protein KSP35_21470 [Aquihabitans sp. G128]
MRTPDRSFEVEAFGVGIDVSVAEPSGAARWTAEELAAAVARLLPPGSTERPSALPAAARFRVEPWGGGLVLEGAEGGAQGFDDPTTGLHALDAAIREAVALTAPGLVFVHAGVVALGEQALVLPGRSMAGKTSLVAALVEAGATYLSDEYAVLDGRGEVHPYARRLSVRAPEGRREVPVEELGGAAATGPLRVGVVAALRYRPGGRWSVEAGSGGACALALVDNAIAAQTRSAEVLRTVAEVARGARFVHGERGERPEAVARLQDLLTS